MHVLLFFDRLKGQLRQRFLLREPDAGPADRVLLLGLTQLAKALQRLRRRIRIEQHRLAEYAEGGDEVHVSRKLCEQQHINLSNFFFRKLNGSGDVRQRRAVHLIGDQNLPEVRNVL